MNPNEIPTPIEQQLISELAYSDGRIFKKLTNSEIGFLGANNRYYFVNFKGKSYKRSRVSWLLNTGKWPNNHIDHIDGNRYNDKFENLRDVTNAENNRNYERHRNGYLVGTTFNKTMPSNPWIARIKRRGITKTIGAFKTQQEAHEAYMKELENENSTRRN